MLESNRYTSFRSIIKEKVHSKHIPASQALKQPNKNQNLKFKSNLF